MAAAEACRTFGSGPPATASGLVDARPVRLLPKGPGTKFDDQKKAWMLELGLELMEIGYITVGLM